MASSAKSVCNPSSGPFFFLVCCLRRPELLSAAHVAHTGDRGVGCAMLLVLFGELPQQDPCWLFGRKRLWHALFRPRKRTPSSSSSSSVGRFGFSIARRYCTLVGGAVFGDLLPTCTSSKGRWSTLQSTFSILEKQETETLAVGSGDLLRFPFSFYSSLQNRFFWR